MLQRDELFWVVVAAAGFSLILVYLASAQPWRRWRPMRAASLIAQASRMRVSNHHVFFTVAGLLLVILCLSSLTMIEPGHRGVVFHLFEGVQSETLTEGVHFLLTGLNRVTVYDTRSRVYHVRNRTSSPPPSPSRSASQPQDHLLWTPTADGLKVALTSLYDTASILVAYPTCIAASARSSRPSSSTPSCGTSYAWWRRNTACSTSMASAVTRCNSVQASASTLRPRWPDR